VLFEPPGDLTAKAPRATGFIEVDACSDAAKEAERRQRTVLRGARVAT
jgi:hypothetical protein